MILGFGFWIELERDAMHRAIWPLIGIVACAGAAWGASATGKTRISATSTPQVGSRVRLFESLSRGQRLNAAREALRLRRRGARHGRRLPGSGRAAEPAAAGGTEAAAHGDSRQGMGALGGARAQRKAQNPAKTAKNTPETARTRAGGAAGSSRAARSGSK